jgi:hypothetical protein
MDESENILYESISFNINDSIVKYINLVTGTFKIKHFDSEQLIKKIKKNIDHEINPLVYFGVEDIYYAWMSCDLCTLSSMN